MMPIKRVLVPIDFGEASDAALVYGRNLAKAFRAELHVLHVMENQFLRPTFKSTAAVETGIANRVSGCLTPEDRATLHTVTASACPTNLRTKLSSMPLRRTSI